MIHGIRYVRQDVSYISKNHYCPICNTRLNAVKVSKVINSNSEEAKDLPPILPKTVIGRKQATRCKVYKGAEHEQTAQQPVVVELKGARK